MSTWVGGEDGWEEQVGGSTWVGGEDWWEEQVSERSR